MNGDEIEKWQERLNATFGNKDGVVGYDLVELQDAEKAYGYWIAESFRGFMAISEAFLSFHFGTPEMLNQYVAVPLQRSGGTSTSAHQMGVVQHLTAFRILRTARELLFIGSPYEGAALLRTVFDATIIRSALMQGLTSVEATEGIEGLKPGEKIDEELARRARIKEEKRIDSIMIGNSSGLSEDTRQELFLWEGLLHAQIHGAKLSQTEALPWLRGEKLLSMLPQPGTSGAAMLMNRWVEVAWMAHRLFPTLQLAATPFPDEWRMQWKVLDESFVPIVQALSSELDKKIGDAMVDFVTTKFPFSVDSVCPN